MDYSDEQRAKKNWEKDPNPYAALPRMVMMTYQLPDSISEIVTSGEFDQFDLNIFSATGDKENAKFKHKNEVQKWLDLIRGSYAETTLDDLRMGAGKPPMPFSHTKLLNILSHTFWFMPSVACHAMKNSRKSNKIFFITTIKLLLRRAPALALVLRHFRL